MNNIRIHKCLVVIVYMKYLWKIFVSRKSTKISIRPSSDLHSIHGSLVCISMGLIYMLKKSILIQRLQKLYSFHKVRQC